MKKNLRRILQIARHRGRDISTYVDVTQLLGRKKPGEELKGSRPFFLFSPFATLRHYFECDTSIETRHDANITI